MTSSGPTPKQKSGGAAFNLPIELDLREGSGKTVPAHIERVSTGFFQLSSPVHLQNETILDLLIEHHRLEVEVLYCKGNDSGGYVAGVRLTTASHGGVRREPRIPLDLPARLITPDSSGSVPARMVDISRSGLGLRVGHSIPLGTGVSVQLPGGMAFGEVRHCTKRTANSWHVGLSLEEFIARDDGTKKSPARPPSPGTADNPARGLMKKIFHKE